VAAFDEYLAERNAERLKIGLTAISFSRWARETLLGAIGRADLTEAGNPIVSTSRGEAAE